MTFGIRSAIAVGFMRPIKNWRLWIGVYLVDVVLAAFLTVPFAGVLSKDISGSLVGRSLISGLDLRWYTSFLSVNGSFFRFLIPQTIFAFVIFMLLEIFFAGGFYSTFSGRERAGFGKFLSDGSSYFFSLFFITLVEMGILVLLVEEIGGQSSNAAVQLIAAIAFAAVCFIFDFVKTAIVVDGDGLWNKVHHGLTFIARHPFSTIGIYLCCLSINAMIAFLFFVFYLTNDSTSAAGVAIEITVAQIFVLLRIFSRLIFYASEAAIYKENQIEVIKVKPEMLE